MTSNVALICGDGAIRGGFIAGAVTRLLEKYPEQMTVPRVITASSASVGGMFYYLSHSGDHPGREIWIKDLSSKKFIDYAGFGDFFSSKPVYDIDYMADEVFRNKHPISLENVLNSQTAFFFPIYNLDLRRIEVFTNRSLEEIDAGQEWPYKIHSIAQYNIYDLIRAASAAQFVYDKPVKIGSHRYMDAAAWCPYLIGVPGIKGTKKIVIVTKSNNSLRRRLTYLAMGFVFPFLFGPFRGRHLPWHTYFQYGRKPWVIDALSKEASVLECYDQLITIKPNVKLGGQTDNSLETLRRNFIHGYDIIDEKEDELERFFAQ